MKTICKVSDGGATCPRGLTICCGTCEYSHDCCDACDQKTRQDFQNCPDAEVITDELIRFQSAVPEVIQKMTTLIRMKKELDEQEKTLKQELVKAMETFGVKSFETDQIKMVYVAPTTRSTIDGARLKKDHPDIAEQYSKTSNVSASVRVTVK